MRSENWLPSAAAWKEGVWFRVFPCGHIDFLTAWMSDISKAPGAASLEAIICYVCGELAERQANEESQPI